MTPAPKERELVASGFVGLPFVQALLSTGIQEPSSDCGSWSISFDQ